MRNSAALAPDYKFLRSPAYLTSGDFAKFYDQAQEVVLFAALTK